MPPFQGSQRRDIRRRLAAAGHSSRAAAEPVANLAVRSGDRRPGLYAQKALPEHHASSATRIPIRSVPFFAATFGILLPPALLTAVAVLDDRVESLLASVGDRWENTIAAARCLVALRSPQGFAAATGLACFLLAAALAAATKNVRRHRLDDHQGRYRAWGWLSLLLVVAGLEVVFPLGPLFCTLITDATGWSLLPEGSGWWPLLVATGAVPIGLWAVLPLTQRFAPGLWLSGALGAWLTAEGISLALAAGWEPASERFGSTESWQLAADSLRVFVPSLAAIGTLVASRGVIREARGQVEARPALSRKATAGGPTSGDPAGSPTKSDQAMASGPKVEQFSDRHGEVRPVGTEVEKIVPSREAADRFGETEPPQPAMPQLLENGDSTSAGQTTRASTLGDDTSESAFGDRRLSKAERRRLRKRARNNQAA